MSRTAVPFPWITGLTKEQQRQLYEDFRALAGASRHSGHRPVTLVVAAHNSSAAGRRAADYVCNGSNDAAVLQEAVDELDDAGGGGGQIRLLEGDYALGTTSINVSGANAPITISGQDRANTQVTSANASRTFLCSGGDNLLTFRELGISNTSGTGAAIETTTAQVEVDGCGLTGFIGFHGNYGVGPQGSWVHDCHVDASGTNSRGIRMSGPSYDRITGNIITVSGAGNGIHVKDNGLGYVGPVHIENNTVYQPVKNGSANGIYIGWDFYSTLYETTVIGNKISNYGVGIFLAGGVDTLIVSNQIANCTMGIDVGGPGENTTVDRAFIASNIFYGTNGGTAHVRVRGTSLPVTSDVVIAFNDFNGSTPANAVVIGTGCTNCGVFFNDTYAGYASAALSDSGTSTRTEVDMLGSGAAALLPTGGTANQVLKKNSATNYDAGWALDPAIDLAAAKGDLLVGLAVDSLTRLGVDRDGQILMTDSTTAEGVKWGPKVTIGSTQPSSPRPGDIWIDTT